MVNGKGYLDDIPLEWAEESIFPLLLALSVDGVLLLVFSFGGGLVAATFIDVDGNVTIRGDDLAFQL